MDKDTALDLALEAGDGWRQSDAIAAIKQVRSAPVQKRPQNCGTGYCSCVECVMETAPVQEPVATIDSLEQEIYENTREFVSLNVMEWLLKRLNTTPPAATVQVSPLEFVTMAMEKEHLVGKPLFWAEWPNKENT